MSKNVVVQIGSALREELIAHRVFVAIVLLYVVFAMTLGYQTQRDVNLFLYLRHLVNGIVIVGAAAIYLRLARLLGSGVRKGIFKTLYTDIKNSITLSQIIGGALLFLFFTVFFSAFQSVKIMIPDIKPFTYDVLFSDLDRMVHFGHYPHELVQPFLGNKGMTFASQFFYNVWFLLMTGVLAWQMFDRRNPRLRMQFLVSFTLSWFLIGSIGAIHLSSAGPVYFDRVTGLEGPYGAHMEWLWSIYETSPLFTLDLQELLWVNYTDTTMGSRSGISAMPSMHVSIATVLFLFFRHQAAWVKWAGGIFLVAILLGSVHLAWHYAIDGYLGMALVVGIWWSVGRFYLQEPAPSAAQGQGVEVFGA